MGPSGEGLEVVQNGPGIYGELVLGLYQTLPLSSPGVGVVGRGPGPRPGEHKTQLRGLATWGHLAFQDERLGGARLGRSWRSGVRAMPRDLGTCCHPLRRNQLQYVAHD